jgi:activator of 2-hydroxyglutaryl-CoA dehydratase
LDVIIEIKAHALGARQLFPNCRTILDVGGQDSKVILMDERGRVTSFQMNDKCAAGTGRFLGMMAVSLGYLSIPAKPTAVP